MSIRPTLPLSLLATLLLFAGCSPAPVPSAPPPPPSVTVAVARTQSVNDTRQRVGQITAVEDVEIRARITGYIQQRAFTEGGTVQKDDLLYVIEPDAYQAEVRKVEAELQRAEATLRKANLDLERARGVRQRNAISQSELDGAQAVRDQAAADVDASKADLNVARLNLSYTEIRAPFAGRVGRSDYSIGDLVSPQSGPLTTLVQLDPIHVNWSVNEEVALQARRIITASNYEIGDTSADFVATLQLPDGSTYPHKGRIDFLDNRMDSGTGTQTIRAEFPNPQEELVPGQYAVVSVQVGAPTMQLVIPQSAVQEDIQGRFVLVVGADDTVSVRRVTLGSRVGVLWVVREGLAEGERVIYEGVQKVRPGAKVDAVVAEPVAPAAA
ncbi:MAG: efflux RND transporter periplasmic adaptor subunit [Gammaproteobacteria bacterium]|nr:efflux RND transporter periplasmic adaptor subunit [Gammaproteobacteria bacterium]